MGLDLGDRCCMLSTHKFHYADVSCLLSFYVMCVCADYFDAIHFRTFTTLCVSNLQRLHTDLYYVRRSVFFGCILCVFVSFDAP